MKKRIRSVICGLLSMLALCGNVRLAASAGAPAFEDIDNHWAKNNIIWNVENGYFSGVSATSFAPDATMTRGMFVTVLARVAGEDPEKYRDWYIGNLFDDVAGNAYYATTVNWAVLKGVAAGTGGCTFSPDLPVTREQMSVFIVRFLETYDMDVTESASAIVGSFSDAGEISGYARMAVEWMRTSGLISGRPDGNGGYRFDPKAGLTRAECATVLRQLVAKTCKVDVERIEPESVSIAGYFDEAVDGITVNVGEEIYFYAILVPDDATNQNVIFVSSDPSVVRVTLDGTAIALKSGNADVYAVTSNRKFSCGACEYDRDNGARLGLQKRYRLGKGDQNQDDHGPQEPRRDL